jgi:exoribonuclease R
MIYGVNKYGHKIYLFTPSEPIYPNFIVPMHTKPTQYKRNIYIVIKPSEWQANSMYPHGECVQIIGEIGIFDNEITNRLFAHNFNIPPLSGQLSQNKTMTK